VKRLARSTVLYIVLGVVVLVVVTQAFRGGSETQKLTLNQFEKKVAAGQVKTADVSDRDNTIKGSLTNDTKYKVNYVKEDAPNVMSSRSTTRRTRGGWGCCRRSCRSRCWSASSCSS